MRTGAVATTQAQFDSIRAEVRRVTARLGQVTDLDRRDIEHAVDAVQVSAPSAELVALAVDDTEMGPLAMLTCALALRRAACPISRADTATAQSQSRSGACRVEESNGRALANPNLDLC